LCASHVAMMNLEPRWRPSTCRRQDCWRRPKIEHYSAIKAALRNLARSWAEDLKGTGVRVNVLSPGATATELAKAALCEEGQKVYASMTPLQRMVAPAEIGAAAGFLASQYSSFMTTSEVAVDRDLAQL
jgi:NAD(P)-dependent dehydrogenase (short-subunit alcohol dehydrogenase family)